MKKSQHLFYLLISFIIGNALGFLLPWNFLWLNVFLGIALFIILISRQYRAWLLLIIFLILGIMRAQWSQPIINSNHIAFYNEQKIEFHGIIKQEVDVRQDHVKYTISTNQVITENNNSLIHGNVLVKAPLYPRYEYGDELNIICQLKTPEPIEDFDYDKYLARYNIYALCYNPQIQLVQSVQGNWPIAKLLDIKDKFSQVINQILPEPQASFLAGILLGSRRGIPQDLMNAFNTTGVTHIIAISGYNITLIAVLMQNLLKSLQINRKKSFYLSTAAIICFVILTGASAAVVRAAIMGILVLFVQQVGRISNPKNILALTAAIMIALNPKILIWDVGFQLSFLATIGLIYFSPKIKKYFLWLPQKLALQENTYTTLSAIVFTTPLILYQFGRLSIIAPLANLLILPAIPAAMAIGFIGVILGLIWLKLGIIFSWLTWIVLQYVIIVIENLAKLPFASVQVHFNFWLMLISYLILLIIINPKICLILTKNPKNSEQPK